MTNNTNYMHEIRVENNVWPNPPRTGIKNRPDLQYSAASSTHEGAHCHVDICGTPLLAVEAFLVVWFGPKLPKKFQMFIVLLPLGSHVGWGCGLK